MQSPHLEASSQPMGGAPSTNGYSHEMPPPVGAGTHALKDEDGFLRGQPYFAQMFSDTQLQRGSSQ